MVKAGTVVVDVKANTAQFNRGMKSAGVSVKRFSTIATAALATVAAAMAAMAVAFVAMKVTQWFKDAIKAASAAQETFSKFSVVFGEVGEEAELMAQDLRENFGLASSSAKELLSSTGDLLTGIGATGEEALKLSGTISKLGVDLASFNNLQGGATQAVDILNKAILGERESLTTLKVKILEADVQQRLLEKGQKGLIGTQLLLAKAYATVDLVIEQSAKAQGDFARTQEGFANQSRILAEDILELKEAFGKELLPVLTDFIKLLTENEALMESMKTALVAIARAIATILEEIILNVDLAIRLVQGLKKELEGKTKWEIVKGELTGKPGEGIAGVIGTAFEQNIEVRRQYYQRQLELDKERNDKLEEGNENTKETADSVKQNNEILATMVETRGGAILPLGQGPIELVLIQNEAGLFEKRPKLKSM